MIYLLIILHLLQGCGLPDFSSGRLLFETSNATLAIGVAAPRVYLALVLVYCAVVISAHAHILRLKCVQARGVLRFNFLKEGFMEFLLCVPSRNAAVALASSGSRDCSVAKFVNLVVLAVHPDCKVAFFLPSSDKNKLFV